MRLPTIYLSRFAEELRLQLERDAQRWGETWLQRPKEGQEDRTRQIFNNYFDQFEQADTPVPWLKIAGGALICWAREQTDYPPL